MVAWSERDERNPVVIWIRVHVVVGFFLIGGWGVRFGNLTPSLRRSGRFRYWHWLVGNHIGQCRCRGTRHKVDVGCFLVYLARTGVFQVIGEEVWPTCLGATPDFGVSREGQEQQQQQDYGSTKTGHGAPRRISIPRGIGAVGVGAL